MHALLTPCCVGLLLSCVDCCEPQALHLFVNLLLGHCQGEVFFEEFSAKVLRRGLAVSARFLARETAHTTTGFHRRLDLLSAQSDSPQSNTSHNTQSRATRSLVDAKNLRFAVVRLPARPSGVVNVQNRYRLCLLTMRTDESSEAVSLFVPFFAK